MDVIANCYTTQKHYLFLTSPSDIGAFGKFKCGIYKSDSTIEHPNFNIILDILLLRIFSPNCNLIIFLFTNCNFQSFVQNILYCRQCMFILSSFSKLLVLHTFANTVLLFCVLNSRHSVDKT